MFKRSSLGTAVSTWHGELCTQVYTQVSCLYSNLAGTTAPLVVALTKKYAIKVVAQHWGLEHDLAYAK